MFSCATREPIRGLSFACSAVFMSSCLHARGSTMMKKKKRNETKRNEAKRNGSFLPGGANDAAAQCVCVCVCVCELNVCCMPQHNETPFV